MNLRIIFILLLGFTVIITPLIASSPAERAKLSETVASASPSK